MDIEPTAPPARPRANVVDLLRTRLVTGSVDGSALAMRVEQADRASQVVLYARYSREDHRLLAAEIEVVRPHCRACRAMPQAIERVIGRRGGMRNAIVDAMLAWDACGLLPDLLVESLQGAVQASLHVDLTPKLMVCGPDRLAELRVILRANPRLVGSCLALAETNPEIVDALASDPNEQIDGLHARPQQREGLTYQRLKSFTVRADPDRLLVQARMTDLVHELGTELIVDPASQTIVDVGGRLERHPQAICPVAAGELEPARGQPVGRPVIEDFARRYGRAGCNHLAMLLVDSCTVAADVLGGGLTRSADEPCPIVDVLDREFSLHRHAAERR